MWYPPLHGWYSHKEMEEEHPPLVDIIYTSRVESVVSSNALYRKSDLCISRMKLRGHIRHFYLLYIPRIGLPTWLQQNRQTDPGNRSHTIWKLEDRTFYCNYVLEIIIIYGNT
jgi:hypothetical protein